MSSTNASVTTHTIAPVAILDVPMVKQGFEVLDDDGVATGEYMTIRDKCTDKTYGLNGGAYTYRLSPDGEFISFGYAFNSSRINGIGGVDDLTRAHNQASTMGLIEMDDYSLPLNPNSYLILDQAEWQKFMITNPTFEQASASA